MSVRHNNPEEVFPKRLKELMVEYVKEDGSTGLKCIELARLLYERQNPKSSQTSLDEKYAIARENAVKALAQKIGRFRNGKYFPQWRDLVDLANLFGKPIGYLIGETDCDSYELQDVADFIGLDGKTVAALRQITRTVSSDWLLHQTTLGSEKSEAYSALLATGMAAKANAEPMACRAALDRMITTKAFLDLLISLANVGNEKYNRAIRCIDPKAAKSLQESGAALKAARFEAFEFYVRVVDEMFADIPNKLWTAADGEEPGD